MRGYKHELMGEAEWREYVMLQLGTLAKAIEEINFMAGTKLDTVDGFLSAYEQRMNDWCDDVESAEANPAPDTPPGATD